jgi:hypothetical protein
MIPCHTMLAEIRWDEEAGLGGMLLAPKSATCSRRNVADSLDRLRPSGVRRSRIRFPSPSKRCFSLAWDCESARSLGLKWGAFDWQNLVVKCSEHLCWVRRTRSKRCTPKDKCRWIPLSPRSCFAINECTRPARLPMIRFFRIPDTGGPWRAHQIPQHYIRKTAQKAPGIDGIGWHTFPHTCSSMRHFGRGPEGTAGAITPCRYSHDDEYLPSCSQSQVRS